MEIQYSLTEADIFELMQYRFRQYSIHKNPIMVKRILYLIGFIFLAFGSILLTKDNTLFFTFMLLAFILFFFYPTFFYWNLKKKVSSRYRDEKMRASLAKRSLFVSEDSLVEKSSLGETKIYWQSITKLDVTPAYTFISIQGVPSMLIPKDRVSMEDYEGFIAECRKYVRESAT
jgi:hypothetical protein